VPFLAVIN